MDGNRRKRRRWYALPREERLRREAKGGAKAWRSRKRIKKGRLAKAPDRN
jgi:hypothetical protein